MKNGDSRRSGTAIFTKVATGIAFAIVVVFLLLWLGGAFHRKVDETVRAPGTSLSAGRPIGEAQLVAVRKIRVPRIESSVGSIRAVHEAAVASKLLAKVVEVNVTAGQRVKKGDVLVRLDDADLVARSEQAQATTDGARAARDQAKIEYDRVQRLAESLGTSHARTAAFAWRPVQPCKHPPSCPTWS